MSIFELDKISIFKTGQNFARNWQLSQEGLSAAYKVKM